MTPNPGTTKAIPKRERNNVMNTRYPNFHSKSEQMRIISANMRNIQPNSTDWYAVDAMTIRLVVISAR